MGCVYKWPLHLSRQGNKKAGQLCGLTGLKCFGCGDRI